MTMLAVKITPETYHLYKEQVEAGESTLLDLDVVNEALMIKDTTDPDNWTWMAQEHFDVVWEFEGEPDPTDFTPVVPVNRD